MNKKNNTMNNDKSINIYEYRPVRPFIQIPEKVMMYVLQLTPSSFAKVYLYLYNISYGLGYDYTYTHTSVREIAGNLNISVGRTQNAMNYLKKNGALEKIESRAVIGSKYRVLIPEFSAAEGRWFFTNPENVKYMFIKEKLVTRDNIVMAKIKRYKSIKESLQLGLFDKE